MKAERGGNSKIVDCYHVHNEIAVHDDGDPPAIRQYARRSGMGRTPIAETGPGAHAPHPMGAGVWGLWPPGPARRGRGDTHPTQWARAFGACGPRAPQDGAGGTRTPIGKRGRPPAGAYRRAPTGGLLAAGS
jgi:hypothetical protein